MRGRDLYQLTQLANRYLNGQVVAQVKDALARRGDEQVRIERQRRKLERKRVWASRWMTAWALIAAISLVVMVAVLTGAVADGEAAAVVYAIIGALITGTMAVRSARKMVMIKKAQREFEAGHHPASGVPVEAALPPKGSAAREPMKRLADAEKALAQVLAQLSGTAGMPASVPVESVAQAQTTGAEAATALRAVAGQLVAVELARDHAPPLERGPLVEGVQRLREQLDEGLDGYRSLVAAAGRTVAASTAPGPKQELTEATDHLAGLAVALRELSEAAG